MPLALHARLLRVKGEREVLPVGATRAVAVDIRVIAATHHDLETLVCEGRFRDDLFYRLAGEHLHLPPLRERRDLAWLVERMLRESGDGDDGDDNNAEPSLRLSPDAQSLLRTYAWPGNLRELHNAIAYARAVCEDGTIEIRDLPEAVLRAVSASAAAADANGAAMVGEPCAEAQLLLQYLCASHWNISAVAHQMGLSRMTVYRRMKRWGIEAPARVLER